MTGRTDPLPLAVRPVAAHTLQGVDPVIARVLAARGMTRPGDIELSLARLAPVGTLGGVEAAADLLLEHRSGRVIVVGDFDADGATSTALVLRCLRAFGFVNTDFLVPNRFDYGYGLSPEIVDVAAQSAPDLIVTVDNGISSVAGVARARELGIRVLVTDHHLPPEVLPEADVIVNPNAQGDDYPSKFLAGVGVAFCVMVALARRVGAAHPELTRLPARFLDLVALGTVADVVPLDHNNRILVHAGLQRIRSGASVPGIRALIDVAGRRHGDCVASDLGFAVGPRLNAAGRLEDMAIGIRCLLTDDADEAARLALELDTINRARREVEADMQDSALAAVAAIEDAAGLPPCVCLHQADWHQGIVGLVASRVRERVHRPVFAFADEGDGRLKGSGRSIPGVHLRDVLAAVDSQAPGLIDKLGGHAMAAGLSLSADALPDFEARISAAVAAVHPEVGRAPNRLTDGALQAHELTLTLAEALRTVTPWGQGCPEPVFQGCFAVASSRVVGERHLKLALAGGLEAIAFNQADDPLPTTGEWLELAYRLDVNTWRDSRKLQLVVEQWQRERRPADDPPRGTLRGF
ncbi:MAG: single-stranded-DNA-specific exonuclease RecJ [Pseudomonadota bacterium]